MNIQEHIALMSYTYMKVGGPARFFVEVKTEKELWEAIAWAKNKNIPVVVLGAGSNVLVADKGFDGLVVRMCCSKLSCDGERVYAGAGVSMAQVSAFSLQNKLTGFEWAVGIPGTVGGSVYGNAGCFGGEMKDVVDDVTVFNIKISKSYKLKAINCDFAYRESIFKKQKDLIILGATVKLNSLWDAEKKEKQVWIQHMMRERVAEQAIGERTMGSTFKGVLCTDELLWRMQQHDARFQKSGNTCWVFLNRRGMISAGFFIEQAGLKGKKIGGVAVSHKHANFLVHDGTGTAEHAMMLIAYTKEHVHRKFGIMLEEEIQYIGF
ncbi:MAG: UDP-N-acetylenolpyruvoylglucosamine reductase [Candidatus Ryanbacteria bacterium RIFCSPLOWO2_02_FULL_45_11c]|uniref:UDP-N-acetylenolpyruvoylglucosamine reductase n=1 Tax=Candidatus Ryanbacteria bacterium RIFCSPLOWO2_02_FULL_45_11c TaxID=1802128 RepID=A0A1G2H2I9_9BACT|nr:MAG: UDP-N-acetylenolpyruvoylglucosamine reductase [Candidatus Ryanbacteria bacterium RIFCSPLOWO2_02_FULL_45_11c]